ncbi:MAG: hypothetical protein WC616_02360 [Candidatus Omnitrophota bacterium]
MFKKILVILLALFCLTAGAKITVTESQSWPTDLEHQYSFSPGTLSDRKVVDDEVYYIENNVPKLKDMDIALTLVPANCRDSEGTGVDGLAYMARPQICVFSVRDEDFLRYTVVHEIFHQIQFKYISGHKLIEYAQFRNDGKPHTAKHDTPVELFADDCAYLFSSPQDTRLMPKSTYPCPGVREKVWILEALGADPEPYLAWAEKLVYYKLRPDAGKNEIDRCGLIYAERISTGDKSGAESAHRWADLIRGALDEAS